MEEEKPSNIGQKTCGLCNVNISKYCCPRCEILYCSLDCYKSDKHSNCSESFYRACVNEELASYQVNDESKHKMIDILQKLHKNDDTESELIDDFIENVESNCVDSDDDEETDLHERIIDLNLDDADALWNVLTEDERNEFEALLGQGDVSAILPHWESWWMYNKKKKIIEDVTKGEDLEEEVLKKCPTLKAVPILSSLTTVQPSPAIKFNITNILASYVFIMRYFNGELDPVESSTCLLNICTNLDTNTNFDDQDIAVESVVQKCLQSELVQTDKASLDIMKHDTYLILQGPSDKHKTYYCKAALSHLHKVLSDAKNEGKTPKSQRITDKDKTIFSKKFPEHRTNHLPNLDVSKIKKCIKKIEFYLSYIESQGMEYE